MSSKQSLFKVQYYFDELPPRGRAVLCQLPLSVTVFIALLLVVAFYQHLLRNPLFQASVAAHAVILLACMLVPWEKFPPNALTILPMLDLAAIAMTRTAALGNLTTFGITAIFPIVWLAASGLSRGLVFTISFAGPLMMVWMPFLNNNRPWTAPELMGPVFLPIVLLALAVSTRFISEALLLQRDRLAEKDAELRKALDASKERGLLLDAVLDTVGVGLVAVDPNGHDILMNRQQRFIHALASPPGNGDPREDELLIFREDRTTPLPVAERPVYRAVRGETFSDYLIWVGQGPGQRALSTTASVINSENGEFAGAVVAMTDVTELLIALAAKDDFVSNVSHEFRTPLTSIIGYLDLCLENEDDLPRDVVMYLNVAMRNSERLLGLVTDLLSVASGTPEINARPGDLAETICASIDTMHPKASAAGVELVSDVPANLEAFFDPARMGQVLDNLLSNAVKYSPSGSTVTVAAWQTEDGVTCQIEDHGIGMDDAEQKQLFTRFFRAASARDAAIPGVGLGLLIARTIVEGHGGTLTLTSAPGEGTTVRVNLPLAVPVRSAASSSLSREASG